LDRYNTDSELAFEALAEFSVPVLTNQNVRSEFLENHRRVLLAECLVDFYEDYLSDFPLAVSEKLKSHRTSFRRKIDEGRDAKLNPNQIKEFRELLRPIEIKKSSSWDFLCTQYLRHRITPL
jgi:beta-glucosidase/6-phospho-beta-glucosidase/beta-galactosidase